MESVINPDNAHVFHSGNRASAASVCESTSTAPHWENNVGTAPTSFYLSSCTLMVATTRYLGESSILD